MAIEFNKKRKMKQDYDEQIADLTEEMGYYKNKYQEMKDLLNSCREQLTQFEELNEMRNQVILKLEGEIKGLKDKNLIFQTTSSAANSEEYSAINTLMLPTPAKNSHTTPSCEDKSFSLHLQKVNCSN